MANVTLPSLSQGEQFVLNDGDVATPAEAVTIIDGSVVVANGASAALDMSGYEIQGKGKIYCDIGSTLEIVAGNEKGFFNGIRISNGGDLIWRGLLNCGDDFQFTNFGTLTLDNPRPKLADHTPNGEWDHASWKAELRESYPECNAQWILLEGIVRGGGVLHGSLTGPGALVLLELGAEDEHISPHGSLDIPTPSSAYITISGDWAMTSGVISVTVNATYYGQALVADAVTLGGCTLNVTLSGYTPAYTDNFRVVKAPAVYGSIGSFNATASNFDNKGIVSLPNNFQAYNLSGY